MEKHPHPVSNARRFLDRGAPDLQVHVSMPRKCSAAMWRRFAGPRLVSFAFKDRSDGHGGGGELVPL